MRIQWLIPTSMNLEPIVASLQNGDIRVHTFDKTEAIDQGILDVIEAFKPELILYIGAVAGRIPHPDTLRRLKPAKLIHLCLDASSVDWFPVLDVYRTIFDRIVNIDGNRSWEQIKSDITVLCPIATKYYDIKMKPQFNLGFAGGNGSPERRDILKQLDALKKITICRRNESVGSYQDYADFLKKCRFIINFSKTGCGQARQVKARVIETALAGACLIEQRGSPTAQYFTPGEDFLEYDVVGDVLEILDMITQEMANNIAQRLRDKVLAFHHADMIWSKILGGL